jgi:tripartite-type tricarboxylate transporter receptor subunit TctC
MRKVKNLANLACHLLMATILFSLVLSWHVGARAAAQTITIIVGFSPGGTYDLYARVLGQHLGQHLANNPTVVVENMPGAGGIRAANYLYRVAPRDGSMIGTFARGVVIGPLFGQGNFDATKFNWIGSVTDDVNVCLAWHTSPVKSWNDLLTKPFTVAGEGAQADADIYANLIKHLFHAPIKLVSGYPGSNDISLAMERGEVDGACALSYSTVKSTWSEKLQNKDINILFQAGVKKAPDLPNVPLLTDLTQNPHEKEILKLIMGVQGMARPFVAPPGLSDNSRNALRQAFTETMRDAAFLDEIKKMKLEVNPSNGADLEALVTALYQTPTEVVAQAKQAIAEP